MAITTAIRPEAEGPQNNASHPVLTERDLDAFRTGRAEADRLVDLLAFALAAETRQAPVPETVEQLRHQASAALSDHAFRTLHNAVDEIRREAVAEHLGRARRPPSFAALVGANLCALAIAGLVAYALAQHPATQAALAGLLAG